MLHWHQGQDPASNYFLSAGIRHRRRWMESEKGLLRSDSTLGDGEGDKSCRSDERVAELLYRNVRRDRQNRRASRSPTTIQEAGRYAYCTMCIVERGGSPRRRGINYRLSASTPLHSVRMGRARCVEREALQSLTRTRKSPSGVRRESTAGSPRSGTPSP